MPVRRLAALVLALSLAACAPDAPPPVADRMGDAGPDQHDQAGAVLARLTGGAFQDAFDLADALGYTAVVTVVERSPSGAVVGEAVRQVEVAPHGETARVLPRASSGTLAADGDALRLRNPLPALLPDEPPYLDPALRDRYVVRAPLSNGGLDAEATLRPGATGRQPVRRAYAVFDPARGRLVGAEVDRASRSLIYDETSHVAIQLARGPGERLVPLTTVAVTTTSTPLSGPRRVEVRWHVIDVGGTRPNGVTIPALPTAVTEARRPR